MFEYPRVLLGMPHHATPIPIMAAGRFAPLTAGLELPEGSDLALLFVGLSDPRHLIEALLLRGRGTRRARCAMNAPWSEVDAGDR